MSQQSINLQTLTQLLNSADFRDKLLKLFSNCILIQSYLKKHIDERLSDNLFKIYQKIYLYRRLLRFCKAFDMINNLHQIYLKAQKQNFLQVGTGQISSVIVNLLFICFHISEAIMVLLKLGFFKPDAYLSARLITHAFWSVGLFVQLIYYLVRLRVNFTRENELMNQVSNGMETKEFLQSIELLSNERFQYGRVILRVLSDMVCAFQKSGLPEKILHVRFNRAFVGIGGIISSLLYLHQYYRQLGVQKIQA